MTRQALVGRVWVALPERRSWLRFTRARAVLQTRCLGEVLEVLRQMEYEVARGCWAVGFLSYEAAPALDPAMSVRPNPPCPLVWFGLFDTPRIVHGPPQGSVGEVAPVAWCPGVSASDYCAAVRRIQEAIAAGQVYQVNLTYPWQADDVEDLWSLWRRCLDLQPGSYAAFIETPDWVIASVSPELFLDVHGRRVRMQPMKGTAPRCADLDADEHSAKELAGSEKERAENLMIVDMVRNDLGRVANPGSVRVERLWAVEKHPTVWQMTSTVSALTRAPLTDLLAAVFPCASVTGAPKIEAMRTIAALETAPRGVYCGAIGWIAPGRRARFNVAIRTVWFDVRARRAQYGVGAGIVWDSRPQNEWDETVLKARVITEPPEPFRLLETLRWDPGRGYFLLREHLRRLRASAEYFGIPCSVAEVLRTLRRSCQRWSKSSPRRVRLTLDPFGRTDVSSQRWAHARESPWCVVLSTARVSPSDVWLRHKTTRRGIYERARREHPGADDVVLQNDRGELTESTIANLVVRIKGRWYTPPVRCGLLPGCLRARLLRKGRLAERVIRVRDLQRAEDVALINALRGWICVGEVRLADGHVVWRRSDAGPARNEVVVADRGPHVTSLTTDSAQHQHSGKSQR